MHLKNDRRRNLMAKQNARKMDEISRQKIKQNFSFRKKFWALADLPAHGRGTPSRGFLTGRHYLHTCIHPRASVGFDSSSCKKIVASQHLLGPPPVGGPSMWYDLGRGSHLHGAPRQVVGFAVFVQDWLLNLGVGLGLKFTCLF